jgi:hypothetical protein
LPNLTAKEAAFALAYVETGNASEAYRRAYNVRPHTKPESIWQAACRVLANKNVAQRVMELQAEARERLMVTVESLTDELEKARILAMSDEKGASAAVSATMGKAKLHGFLVEKRELSGSVSGGGRFEVDFKPPTNRDLAKAICFMLAEAKAELDQIFPAEDARSVRILAGLEKVGRQVERGEFYAGADENG